jgi:hypothetical protein
LWHEGQFEGRHVRPPVFLNRRPDEAVDANLAEWYLGLVASADRIRSGEWRLLEVSGWPDNDSNLHLVAWAWSGSGADPRLVVVNLSSTPAQGVVRLPWPDLTGRSIRFVDPLADVEMVRDGLVDPGLFVALDGWQFHVLCAAD